MVLLPTIQAMQRLLLQPAGAQPVTPFSIGNLDSARKWPSCNDRCVVLVREFPTLQLNNGILNDHE